ncbi:7-cyano-7-deazaguanine synthase [Colwellia sp. MB02u-18]|uniref:asparagine synthase-related protein n=1 Tax=unclassified Colwellia TaxID=196834 RepID=UPI0015F4AFFE|nr:MULTISPECIES: asparagine synthase C-terminal domain-containing protein [unclassified Colwellia]MBA6222883.1 7-cyano-7-deazaguanine synthase [Colwellia sp. MB3u-45]MBA6267822.1 7-cyano-7-deazaguanine synthase [Colwellia sp. MB3u-43]MBA6322371.1 7-cyano-7-deazaguanine synthase [Colwellia sp. MB02u-19]MBA6324370.1 7-cyano-7-deazaguanine synthase [Colwellia sp. MB02u-18]MBA6332526.1 7-cyano-7-deazaguanine synthase [Colwellia sp. MB02u-12]
MEYKIALRNNKGGEWTVHDNVSVKGYAFDDLGGYFNLDRLAILFENCSDLEQFKKLIHRLNGSFSVVIKTKLGVLLASDITRTFPLFYTKQNNAWIVSDDANFLQAKYSLRISSEKRELFQCTGYVTGCNTLLDSLYQVQAAEVVLLNNEVECYEYWTYATSKIVNKPFYKLQNSLLNILDDVTKRLVESVDGRTVVIPLSGGYDSRLIVSLLKKHKYNSVICFTYGSKTSFEKKIARKVARKHNVKLIEIDYTPEFIDENLDIAEYIDYIKYASNYTSLPHIQDFLSVKYLVKNGLVPTGSIFVPGHSGDLFAGTHIACEKTATNNLDAVQEAIKRKHYCLSDTTDLEITIDYCNPDFFSYSNTEAWSWKERQAKFIVNSLKVYEFFGMEARLPLWDKELAEFFKEIPLEYKNHSQHNKYNFSTNLYENTLFEIFYIYGVGYKKTSNLLVLRKVLDRFIGIFSNQVDRLNNFDYLIYQLNRHLNIVTKGDINSDLIKIVLSILK